MRSATNRSHVADVNLPKVSRIHDENDEAGCERQRELEDLIKAKKDEMDIAYKAWDDATGASFEQGMLELEALVEPLNTIASELPDAAEGNDFCPIMMMDSFLKRSRSHRKILKQIEVLVVEIHEFIQMGRGDALDELECYRQINKVLASKLVLGFKL